MSIRTIKLDRTLPVLDDSFVHFFSGTLVDTGHELQWEGLLDALGDVVVDRILLTSRDAHSAGNIERFPGAEIFALPAQPPHERFDEWRDEPGIARLFEVLFAPVESASITDLQEGAVVDAGDFCFDLISLPVPDRSGAMWHDPDRAITFVGAMPSGRLPAWCDDATCFGEACTRLDSVDLGAVYSRVDPPTDNAAWFKKRAQRFMEQFASTLVEKRSSDELRSFLETDFGGRPDDDLEWASALIRYAPFF